MHRSVRGAKLDLHIVRAAGRICRIFFPLSFLFLVGWKAESFVPATYYVALNQSHASTPLEDYQLVVRRAYAINKLFQHVYTRGWEGANGAIGEAYLYAATGDQSLLYVVTEKNKLLDLFNGTWVDDRAWICLAELYWWEFSGKKNTSWVQDAEKRYVEARDEGRLAHPQGFWSWYSWPPDVRIKDKIFTNSNMNQMVNVACRLYQATGKQRYRDDAVLVWEGDSNYVGIEKTYYIGDGRWEGNEGPAAFGKALPWQGAEYCSIGAALYAVTGNPKYIRIVVETARRVFDPVNGWVDPKDFYQLRMDGNGAFVHFILDAYQIAPDELRDIPDKVSKMLEHVWTNHHGTSSVTLHREIDDGIRNGWNPDGGEDGYGVGEVGTVHAQSQALRAFGVLAYVLHQRIPQQSKNR